MLYQLSYWPIVEREKSLELHLFVVCVLFAPFAIFFQRQLLCGILFILGSVIISSITLLASKMYCLSHILSNPLWPGRYPPDFSVLIYSMMLVTTPAPTVLPPSRIAKRVPSSRAIGAISSTLSFTLSPGITISVPSGSITEPVTSVVRT